MQIKCMLDYGKWWGDKQTQKKKEDSKWAGKGECYEF